MSVLSDRDIRRLMDTAFQDYAGGKAESYTLIIDPLLEPIQPTSVDLRLGHTLIVPKGGHVVDPMRGLGTTDRPRTFPNGHLLAPGQFVLGAVLENIELPALLIAKLEGKSTLARFGLQIENAGYVDPGWKGHLTLELKNLGEDTIVLRPGMVICQIRFEGVSSRPSLLYGDPLLDSHYQRSTQAQAALLGEQRAVQREPSAPENEPEAPTG